LQAEEKLPQVEVVDDKYKRGWLMEHSPVRRGRGRRNLIHRVTASSEGEEGH
jgi:hypothetical protein